MTVPTSPKQSRSLPEKRLALYGVAAGAALAAGASTADANLITLDLTGLPTASRSTDGATATDLFFDVNAASAAAAVSATNFAGADFRFFNFFTSAPFGGSISGLAPGNGIAGINGVESFKALRLQASNFVGPDQNFGQSAKINGPEGNWGLNDSGFLGLQFLIGADTHYGWAKIDINALGNITLDALGYESDPNTPAHAEDPGSSVPDHGSTLALMAIGATGLAVLRSRARPARVTQ
ncbi:MAG TPA: hypothetical protein VGM62_05395 [Chthoniobacterales bacterium]|jgi:hypothetical protein